MCNSDAVVFFPLLAKAVKGTRVVAVVPKNVRQLYRGFGFFQTSREPSRFEQETRVMM
jgi:hypothetical protein